jgi:hypothetical protein
MSWICSAALEGEKDSLIVLTKFSVYSMMPKGGDKIWNTADGGLPHIVNFRIDDAEILIMSEQSEYEYAV